jgi:hypothetical protein
VTADKRCPACRKGYKTEAGYQRHVSTHADDNGRPVCNCLLPVELMGLQHQFACPVSWMRADA